MLTIKYGGEGVKLLFKPFVFTLLVEKLVKEVLKDLLSIFLFDVLESWVHVHIASHLVKLT